VTQFSPIWNIWSSLWMKTWTQLYSHKIPFHSPDSITEWLSFTLRSQVPLSFTLKITSPLNTFCWRRFEPHTWDLQNPVTIFASLHADCRFFSSTLYLDSLFHQCKLDATYYCVESGRKQSLSYLHKRNYLNHDYSTVSITVSKPRIEINTVRANCY
jgi:hypothetical protein